MKGAKLSLPKLQERDQALIMIAIGLVIAALAYVLGYQRLTQETESLESTNATMRNQVTLLERLTNNRAQYETETSDFIDEANEILETFPVDLMEEDLILYALHLDNLDDETFIGAINTPRRVDVGLGVPTREDELVSANDITGQIAANAYTNDGSVLDVSEAELNVSNGSISLNTSYNGFKNLIIDLIGWVNGEEPDTENELLIEDIEIPGAETPETSENAGAVPAESSDEDGTDTEVEEEPGEPEAQTKVVAQRRINQIDLSFDPDTGEYTSMVDISFFAMSGMGRDYLIPDTGVEDHGLHNIFGNQLTNGTLLPPLSDLDPNYVYEAPVPVSEEPEETITTEEASEDVGATEVTGALQTP